MSVISDLHLRAHESYDSRGYSRCAEKLQVLRTVVQHAVDNQHDMIILAGDIFDSQDPPDWLRANFLECLTPCFQRGIEVFIIIGNHETNGETHCYSSLQTLGAMLLQGWLLHVISQPRTIHQEPQILINMVPYMKIEPTLDAVTNWKGHNQSAEHIKILIGHFQVDGAELSGGNAYQIPTILRPHHFSGYDHTLLGHVHQRQIHSSGETDWCYVGSPLSQDFGERDDVQPKGFYDLQIIEDEHTRALSTYLQLVPLKSTPFVQIEVGEETDGFSDRIQEKSKDAVAKVIIVGSQDFLKSEKAQQVRRAAKHFEKEGHAKKIIINTRCTDRQIIDAPEEESVHLDDSMERLCKEKGKEPFLPEGQRFMEEAHNALARDEY